MAIISGKLPRLAPAHGGNAATASVVSGNSFTAGGVITSVPPGVWDKVGGLLSMSRVGDKLHKGAALLGSRSVADLYRGMVSHWTDPASVVLGAVEPLFCVAMALSALFRSLRNPLPD
ncbi:hypothetical protein EBT31_21585 [bacterium]|nr:hypothetical protein [bacterium]